MESFKADISNLHNGYHRSIKDAAISEYSLNFFAAQNTNVRVTRQADGSYAAADANVVRNDFG